MFFRFSKKNNDTQKPDPFKASPSIIASDMNILGHIISEGAVDITGHIDGNVKAPLVTIRARGKVMGDVEADQVHNYGHVHGMIKGKSVHLYEKSRVEGVVIHETLVVEDGANVDGKFKRMGKEDTSEPGRAMLEGLRLVS